MSKNLDGLISEIKSKKREIRVGVDIDNTLIYIPVIAYINHKFGTSYTDADFKEWDLSNFPVEIANEVKFQFTNPEFMCKTRGYIWSYPTVRDWHASGIKLYAITRRAPNLFRDTRYQIEREFPGIFEDVFFVSPTDSKARLLRKVEADIHIDDYDVDDTIRSGIKTWLITNESTTYNHHLRENTRLNQALSLRYVKVDEKKWK
jgi:uncharacterized HAD superfamily protein